MSFTRRLRHLSDLVWLIVLLRWVRPFGSVDVDSVRPEVRVWAATLCAELAEDYASGGNRRRVIYFAALSTVWDPGPTPDDFDPAAARTLDRRRRSVGGAARGWWAGRGQHDRFSRSGGDAGANGVTPSIA